MVRNKPHWITSSKGMCGFIAPGSKLQYGKPHVLCQDREPGVIHLRAAPPP